MCRSPQRSSKCSMRLMSGSVHPESSFTTRPVAPRMIAAGGGALIVTGNTSALRGKPNFAGFAPTKAAQRILAESIARDIGPKGVHVAYVVIDAVIDLAWTRERYPDAPDGFFIKRSAIAD